MDDYLIYFNNYYFFPGFCFIHNKRSKEQPIDARMTKTYPDGCKGLSQGHETYTRTEYCVVVFAEKAGIRSGSADSVDAFVEYGIDRK